MDGDQYERRLEGYLSFRVRVTPQDRAYTESGLVYTGIKRRIRLMAKEFPDVSFALFCMAAYV